MDLADRVEEGGGIRSRMTKNGDSFDLEFLVSTTLSAIIMGTRRFILL